MIKSLLDFTLGILVIISAISIVSYAFMWAVNQWLSYFQWPEITYWQSMAVFIFIALFAYLKFVLTNYFNK